MSFLKEVLKKMVFREKYTSQTYINFLKEKGVLIGEDCTIFNPKNTIIDYQNPHMIEIGNHVQIADGVKVLTHDYSLSVIGGVYGDIIGSVRETSIGNNVFIGMNAIILAGVTVEDNVIIGAGSVITHNCRSNSVYAGNPGKLVCSIEQLYEKRKKREIDDARRCALKYYKHTGNLPNESIMREYLMLFSDRKKEIPRSLRTLMNDTGNYSKSEGYYYSCKQKFDGLDDFLKYCKIFSSN